jgi:ABC-type antimicrobial peptide transport system permease subunit
MQIPMLAGRAFTARDTGEAPAVAMVNEVFAQRHFSGRNPVGQHLAAMVMGERRDLEIVGLVRNTNAAGLRVAPPATVYVPYAQLTGERATTLSVRATGAPGQVSAAIQQMLQSRLDAPADIRPLTAQVDATIIQERMMATLASAFGLLALTLACVGLYGLLAYSVAQRTKEIGIRMALGAPARRVVALVLERGTRLVLIGIAVGLPAAWAASRWVESMLFGLSPADPVAIGGAVLLLAAAAQVAGYLPARRASRVDPLVALRHE